MNIDYMILATAMQYYKDKGYEFVEVPWIVSRESHEATASPPDGAFVVDGRGCLVGSAEQGFIEIINQLKPNKKYASISPCFRKNDNKDYLHQETFMKLELFAYNANYNNYHLTLLFDAERLFLKLGMQWMNRSKLLKSESLFDKNIDICYNDVELGSYGYRDIIREGISYRIEYGTGLALPRFSHMEHQS
jgi:seryl-tRNA synthetase